MPIVFFITLAEKKKFNITQHYCRAYQCASYALQIYKFLFNTHKNVLSNAYFISAREKKPAACVISRCGSQRSITKRRKFRRDAHRKNGYKIQNICGSYAWTGCGHRKRFINLYDILIYIEMLYAHFHSKYDDDKDWGDIHKCFGNCSHNNLQYFSLFMRVR